MKKLNLSVLTFIILAGSLSAQTFLPRSDHQARLEPAGRVMNGAGQSLDAFQNYWNVMRPNSKPIVSMYYVGLKGIQKHWAKQIGTQLLQLGNKFVIPQIGLSMTVDGSPDKHYEGDVAAGKLDGDIAIFLDGLQELALPVYLRIGYEFNGLSWNGYQPQTFQQAFQRITNKIRDRDLEVATVWDCAIEGTKNLMDFYPGDAFVDWFGINLFSVEHLTHPDTYSFLNLAVSHNKPVMIGESTPRYVGVLDGQISWTKWFVPYFNLIHSRPEIKMFCYINWDWSQYPQWANWGDCRIEKNDYVKQQFSQEMDSPTYLHAVTEREFRKLLPYHDNGAPPAIGQLSALAGSFPKTIQWNAVTDLSGIAHYAIYRYGALAGYSLLPKFDDFGIKAGQQIQYGVTAIDRAGNEGISTNILVQIPNQIDRIINGEFNDGNNNWSLGIFSNNATATFDIDSTSKVSGQNSAHVVVAKSSGTDWHIQLRQSIAVWSGMSYQISYKARASGAVNIAAVVQSDHSPYNIYLNSRGALTTAVQSFSASFVAAVDDSANLEFFLGNIGQAEVWIDSISVTDTRLKQTVPPLATQPISPISGSQAPSWISIFTWSEVTASTYYFLWMNAPSGNAIKTWYTSAEAHCGSGTCWVKPTIPLAEMGSYAWWVQTWNDAGYGPWSVSGSFVTPSGTPDAATLVAPSGTTDTEIPTYTWNENSNATHYYLWVKDPNNPSAIQQWYRLDAANCARSTCSVTPDKPLIQGACTWWIQAWNPNGFGPWSNGSTFNVTIRLPGKAALISPSGAITTQGPAYLWNAVPGVTWYYLWVHDASSKPVIQLWLTSSQAGCISGSGNCSITPAMTLSPGDAHWFIQTYNSAGYGLWSEGMTFAVPANPATQSQK